MRPDFVLFFSGELGRGAVHKGKHKREVSGLYEAR